ncbi:hypothetical protein B0H19DRAFT_1060340 [Mycena capillaripes]|nr:hypothetical protein B0H19DRAFT_1060340 [Mycena capillaripes]
MRTCHGFSLSVGVLATAIALLFPSLSVSEGTHRDALTSDVAAVTLQRPTGLERRHRPVEFSVDGGIERDVVVNENIFERARSRVRRPVRWEGMRAASPQTTVIFSPLNRPRPSEYKAVIHGIAQIHTAHPH